MRDFVTREILIAVGISPSRLTFYESTEDGDQTDLSCGICSLAFTENTASFSNDNKM